MIFLFKDVISRFHVDFVFRFTFFIQSKERVMHQHVETTKEVPIPGVQEMISIFVEFGNGKTTGECMYTPVIPL